MNLPHLPPIRFAKEILTCNDKTATIVCEFPYPPTLPMLTEAAAQASSAFAQTTIPQNGFLVLMKDISLYVKLQGLTCRVVITERLSFGNSSEFYFEVLEEASDVMCASGIFMVILEEVQ